MSRHKIFETNTFSEDLNKIAKSSSKRIEVKLREYVYPRLIAEPHFGPQIKKLKNYLPPTWRYRIGSWRFFYEISEEEKTVYMISATHRSEAYRK